MFYALSNLITLGNFFCGTQSIYFTIQGKPLSAAYMILGAMFLDFLDGEVARFTKVESEFGSQLDSLADLVSFGVAPAMLVCALFLQEYGIIGYFLGFLYAVCGMLRLARYNIQTKGEKNNFFWGLPIPAAAGLLTSFILIYFHLKKAFFLKITPLLMIFLALLMISKIKYSNLRGFGSKRRIIALFITLIFVIAIFFHYAHSVLLACFLGYTLSGIFLKIAKKA